MSNWRSVLWKLCGAVVLVCVAVLVVSPAVNPIAFRDRLSSLVLETTGLRVAFQGEIRPRFFPRLGVEVDKVEVLAPLELGGDSIATLDRLEAGVRLLPLLGKRIELGTVTLEGLNVNLIRFENGSYNLPAPPVRDVAVQGHTVLVTTNDGKIHSFDMRCEGLRLTRTSFTLDDRTLGRVTHLTDLNFSTGSLAYQAPFDVQLSLAYALSDPQCSGQLQLSGTMAALPESLLVGMENISGKMTFSGKGLPVESAQAELSGALKFDGRLQQATARDLRLALTGKGGIAPKEEARVSLALDATADLSAGRTEVQRFSIETAEIKLGGKLDATFATGTWSVRGAAATNEFNPRQAAAAFGLSPFYAFAPRTFSKARLNLIFEASPGRLGVSGEGQNLDATTFSLAADYRGGAKNTLDFTLKADALNLDPYLLPAQPENKAPRDKKPQPSRAYAGPRLPVASSGTVEVGKLQIGKLQASEVSAKLTASGGRFAAPSFKASLYQGRVSGSMTAELDRPVPAYTLYANAQDVSVAPLLAAFQDKALLSGRLAVDASVSAQGDTPTLLLESLGGKGLVIVTAGELHGVTLPFPVSPASKPGAAPSVAFDRAGATFTLRNGVATTADFVALIPPHRFTAQGWLNLPAKTLDVSAWAVVGGKVSVPVHVSGLLDAPKVSVDAQVLSKAILNSVVSAPGQLGKGALDAVGNFLGITKK